MAELEYRCAQCKSEALGNGDCECTPGGGRAMTPLELGRYYEEEQKRLDNWLESTKETNPKDAVGIKKGPITTVSGPVMAELGVAMLEGARKYGRHNYRVAGVRASVYRDATWRHLAKWWAGQSIDPDSGVHHLIKAMASLMVLRDAQLFDKCEDDRPPALPDADKFWANIDKMAVDLILKHPNPKPPYTQKGLDEDDS